MGFKELSGKLLKLQCGRLFETYVAKCFQSYRYFLFQFAANSCLFMGISRRFDAKIRKPNPDSPSDFSITN
jgi:hypothetical protein